MFKEILGYFYKIFCNFKILGKEKKSVINTLVNFSYKNNIKAGNLILKTAIFKILDKEVDYNPKINVDSLILNRDEIILVKKINEKELLQQVKIEIKHFYTEKNRKIKNVTK